MSAIAPYPAAAVAPRGSRTWMYWLIGVGSVVVGGFIALVVIGLIRSADEVAEQHPASLDTPETVAGLELSTDPTHADLAEQLKAGLLGARNEDGEGLDSVIAAFYLDPNDVDQLLMLSGGTMRISDPESGLDDHFAGALAGSGADRLYGEVDFDVGQMGGVARCGQVFLEDAPISICGWADHGSFVVGWFYWRGVQESADLLLEIREEILVRPE